MRVFSARGQRDGKVYEITIDDDDFERIMAFRWSVRMRGLFPAAYRVVKTDKKKPYHRIWLHNEVMNHPKDARISPRNGKWLDCRKENLCAQPIDHYLKQKQKV